MAADIAAAITAAVTAIIDRVPWSNAMKISTEILIPASMSNVWGAPRGMSMNAKITKLEPAREIVMEFGVRGFVIIEERYLLAREGTHVRLIHSANLKGLLPLIGARLSRKRLVEKFQLPIDRLAQHLASKKQTPRSGRKS